MKLENLEILKLTVHKVYGRSKSVSESYAEECKRLIKLEADGMDILNRRISSCINHKSKFYELDLVDDKSDSFFEKQSLLWGSDELRYLKISQSIAEKAAESHKSVNIPDALLLVIEAKISTFNTVIVVKAEMSDAFSISGPDLQLIKDIFLSSDKTLYKVGFFLKTFRDRVGKNAYKYFVYDDAFSPSKEDLAHYFYNSFLGLSTEKNSKLLTNKFHRSLTGFIEDHIDFGDKYELMRAIDRAFIDPNRKSITASDFKVYFPNDLQPLFQSQIIEEFPNSFIKDNSITSSIQTKRIALSESTTLLLRNAPEGIITGNTANIMDMAKLKATIDSGNLSQNYNYALIPSAIPIKKIQEKL